MQLGVGSFQHFEHVPSSGGGGPGSQGQLSGQVSAASSPGRGVHLEPHQVLHRPLAGLGHLQQQQQQQQQQLGQHPLVHPATAAAAAAHAAAYGRKSSTASEASSAGGGGPGFDDGGPGGQPGGGAGYVPGSPGGLLLLQRDMASILYLDVQQSSALIYDLIAILNNNAQHFDRSQPPERQNDEAKEKLHQLADFITEEIPVVKKVAPSWPYLGLWLMTKAFDCWQGQLV